MIKRLFLWLMMMGLTMTVTAQRLTSPNGKLTVEVNNGQWIVGYQGQQVLTMKGAASLEPQKMLKAKKEIVHTTDYVHATENDLREALSPKKPFDANLFPAYYQVFSEKFPFAPDLSVLDLVFNEGPEATTYLKQIS